MLIERLRLMKPDHCYPSKHILLFYYWIGRVTEDIKVCDNFSQLKVCDKSNTCFNIWKFLTIKFCFFENVIKQQYTFTSLVHFNVMWLCGSYTYVEECPADVNGQPTICVVISEVNEITMCSTGKHIVYWSKCSRT